MIKDSDSMAKAGRRKKKLEGRIEKEKTHGSIGAEEGCLMKAAIVHVTK